MTRLLFINGHLIKLSSFNTGADFFVLPGSYIVDFLDVSLRYNTVSYICTDQRGESASMDIEFTFTNFMQFICSKSLTGPSETFQFVSSTAILCNTDTVRNRYFLWYRESELPLASSFSPGAYQEEVPCIV